MPTRVDQTIGTRARAPVSIHSAPLVLPVCAPRVEDGSVLVRGDRVLKVGPRTKIEAAYPDLTPVRWPGMIVPGLVDAHLRLDRTAFPPVFVHGVTAVGGVARDLDAASTLGEAGLGGVTYLETRCEDEARWEDDGRDRLITAIGEVDHPGIIGIAGTPPIRGHGGPGRPVPDLRPPAPRRPGPPYGRVPGRGGSPRPRLSRGDLRTARRGRPQASPDPRYGGGDLVAVRRRRPAGRRERDRLWYPHQRRPAGRRPHARPGSRPRSRPRPAPGRGGDAGRGASAGPGRGRRTPGLPGTGQPGRLRRLRREGR